MATALWLLAIQGAVGAFDTLYFHEWRARLPAICASAYLPVSQSVATCLSQMCAVSTSTDIWPTWCCTYGSSVFFCVVT